MRPKTHRAVEACRSLCTKEKGQGSGILKGKTGNSQVAETEQNTHAKQIPARRQHRDNGAQGSS